MQPFYLITSTNTIIYIKMFGTKFRKIEADFNYVINISSCK